MESKIEYRDKTAQEISLPREVYYRCIWTVRDMKRLGEIACAAADKADAASDEGTIVSEDVIMQSALTLKCINDALGKIPDVYRTGIMDNIIRKEAFSDLAHPNTWKRWKLVFLYELARELHLI